VGEIIRRVTGCNLRDFISKELASPLGVEFYCGLPKHVSSRVSKVTHRTTETSAAAHSPHLTICTRDTLCPKVNLGWPDKDASPLQNTYTADPHSPHNLSPDQLQHILAVMDKGTLGYASLTLNSAFRQNMAGVFNRQDVLEVRLTHCMYVEQHCCSIHLRSGTAAQRQRRDQRSSPCKDLLCMHPTHRWCATAPGVLARVLVAVRIPDSD
jgi:hypothetical protein